ncbi:TPA: Fe-Mn family superoxide dismutase [Serratia marcescens]
MNISFPVFGLIQNPESDYIKAFWNVVNWDETAARFAAKK